jgi:hypothetical protein
MVVHDVRTHWNYTHAMICQALKLQEIHIRPLPEACILKDGIQAIDAWMFENQEL